MGLKPTGIRKVPGPWTTTCWLVAGLPVSAEGWSDTWKPRVAPLTVPVSTAVTWIVVWPMVPVAGEEMTARVTPSTLPVAGSAGTVVVVEPPVDAVGWVVVVVVVAGELEHPAARGTTRAISAAAASDAFRGPCIGSS